MDTMLLQHACGLIVMIVGIHCLHMSLFYPRSLRKSGLFRKRYYGDQARIIYAMLGVFFVIGAITLFLYKIV